jgi:hypothetical protein
LYKDHLRQPKAAAQCLAEGGLVYEAIAIYEDLKLYLEIGDLYAKQGQSEPASTAYRQAVEQLLRNGNVLAAAQLVETKLQAPQEAITLLHAAWLESPEASACLRAELQIMSQNGWHRQSLELITDLGRQPTKTRHVSSLVRVLAETGTSYPDHAVRHAAANVAQVKIAGRLPDADVIETRDLVSTLRQLAPEDRLLLRDTHRYVEAKRKQALIEQRRAPPAKLSGPVLVRSFHLPANVQWNMVRSVGQFFFAAGHSAARVTLVRGLWDGSMQSMHWHRTEGTGQLRFLEIDPEDRHAALMAPSRGPAFEEKAFPAQDLFFNKTGPAGTPAWMPNATLALAHGTGVIWSLHLVEPLLVLQCHQRNGALVSTANVPVAWAEPVSMACQRDCVLIGTGMHLIIRAREEQRIFLESPVIGLAGLPAHMRAGAAVMTGHGLGLHWIGTETVETVRGNFPNPLAVFTGDGSLVAVSGDRGRVYDVDSQGVNQCIDFDWPGQPLIGLVRAAEPNEFAGVTVEGLVQVLKITR